ncbi:MAG: efflux RND transporter permease subunit [Pseudomonadota bacterium]
MAFTDLFIRRPVLAIVVSALLLLLGLQAATGLQIREFPELEKSVIEVRTSYPGASARTVQGFVTTPLQRRIADARDIEYITSESNEGLSTIRVFPKLGTDSNAVVTEVIAKTNEAKFELPREVEDPIVSVAEGDDALMYLVFLSEQMSSAQITDYLLRVVQPQLATVEGVGEVEILSGQFLSLRIWLDPARMAALGVTAEDVAEAVRRENYVSSAGATKGAFVQASVDAATDLSRPEDFAEMVVRQDGERRILLSEVARIELDEESSDVVSFANGEESIYISITAAPGANPLTTADAVTKLMPTLNAGMPADLKGLVDFDASVFIEEALSEVVATLIEAALIVILVIFLFLGSMRVVLIPLMAIPLSLVGVLLVMFALGFSLNLLTMLAMVIAIGLVVDDAIVVVENVHRYIENGDTPMEAALKGARQVALPVVAMTLTLAAVYAPIAFLGGLTGVLFTEFAMTLAGAVIVSGLIALTLSPMMCSRVLKGHDDQGRFADWLDREFGRLKGAYQRALNYCLDHRGAVLMFGGALLLSIPLLFQLAQSELAPEEDAGIIFNVGIPPAHTNVEYMTSFVDPIYRIGEAIPEITDNFQIFQHSSTFGGMLLKPWSERERSQQELQAIVQPQLAAVPGMQMFSFGSPPLPGSDSGLPVEFVLSANADYNTVYQVAEEILQAARESGLFAFVDQTLDYSRPEVVVNIDRDKAARLGVSMQSIGDTLSVMLGESEVNRFSMEGRAYKVIPQAERNFRLSQSELERYYVRAASGALVPLSTLIDLGQRVQPNSLSQYQQLNSTTIQGLVMPPNSLGVGLDFLEQATADIAPRSFRVGYVGESLRFRQEGQSFAWLFGASLLVIYLVLAAQFNGFRDPLIVLISVPLSIFGAVVPLALGFATLNIYTQVGLLTLIGLISKHGILIVEFANQLVAQGRDQRSAVLEAAGLRLRPILMTTFATVLGVFPLIIASGAGANSRFSIGLMITAGMLVGTLFTLFVLPAFYLPWRRASQLSPAPAGS